MARNVVHPVTLRAMAAHKAGLIVLAELLAREALRQSPGDAAALNLLGRVAMDLGAPDVAAGRFRAALAADPAFKLAQGNLRDAECAAVPTPADPSERFLLIKAWGAGFWSDVDHVLGALLAAEISGRTPVIHWGHGSRYTDDPTRDAFSTFFQPVSALTIDDLTGRGFDFYPGKWSESNLRESHVNKWHGPDSRFHVLLGLRRPERVVVSDFHAGVMSLLPWIPPAHRLHGRPLPEVYRELVARYLRPADEVAHRVETFRAAHMKGRPWVAAHVRGSDKITETPQLERLHAAYPQAITRLLADRPDAGVFLLTEDAVVAERFKVLFPDRLLTTASARTRTRIAPHFSDVSAVSRKSLGIEVLVDTLLAAGCDAFIGMGSSNVSCMVMHLGQWTPRTALLLDPPLHFATHFALYDPVEGIGAVRTPDMAPKRAMVGI